jgi:hypothetical protein
MLQLSLAIRAYLEALHPVVPWAALTVAIFGLVYATRKLTPQLWIWFDSITPDGAISHVIQGLPSVGLGALLSTVLTGGDFGEAWKGAIAGALAPVLHLILKALPVPYQGAIRVVLAKAGLVALLLLTTGCAALGGLERTFKAVDKWSCDHIGEEEHAALEHQAALEGMSFDQVYALFRAQCALNMAKARGMSVGDISGLHRPGSAPKCTP